MVDLGGICATEIKSWPKALQMDFFAFTFIFAGKLTPLGTTMALRLALCGSACSELKSDVVTLAARMSLIWPAASWRPTICLHKAPVMDAGRDAAMQLRMGERRRLILRTRRNK